MIDRRSALLAGAVSIAFGCRSDPRPTAVGPRLEFVAAGEGPVDRVVTASAKQAAVEGRYLVVYVGATWCEPCRRFHEAATNGSLDRELPPARFLEFDLDRDGERLREAGYHSEYVPLFALPGPDGRASGRAMEGSIKGPGAPAEIAPRLRALLSGR